MSEATFQQAYPFALRAVQARSAAAERTGLLSCDYPDLEQEAMIRVWLALRQYDANRAGLRTFIELVVRTGCTSILRSHRRRPEVEYLVEHHPANGGEFRAADLRTDVIRVLAGMSRFDQTVAISLAHHSPAETSRRLGVSRAMVYRAINRLRAAFTVAGYAVRGGGPIWCSSRRREPAHER